MRRRHLTTAVTLLVLLGILTLGVLLGTKSLFAPFPSATPSPSASPSCAPSSVGRGGRLTTAQVTVSVYNAGTRPGLAGSTQNLLAKRGFGRGALGNAPSTATVRFVQVWTTVKADAAAKLVAAQFGPKTLIKVVKQDLGDGIDVLVGDRFRGLVKAPRSVKVKTVTAVCD